MKRGTLLMMPTLLAVLSGTVVAAPDWQAQREGIARELAAAQESRWQERAEMRGREQRRAAMEAEAARREQLRYRWQQRHQERDGLSVSASNVAGRSTLVPKGPR